MRGRRQSRDLGARPARLFESRSWHPRACQDLKRRSPRGAARRVAREETETRGETEADASERAPVCFRVGVVRRVDACARVPLPRDPHCAFESGRGRSDGRRPIDMSRGGRCGVRNPDVGSGKRVIPAAVRAPSSFVRARRWNARSRYDTTRRDAHHTLSHGTLPFPPRVSSSLSPLVHTARTTSSSSSALRTTPETRALRSSCSSLETISSPNPATRRLRAVAGLSPRLWM